MVIKWNLLQRRFILIELYSRHKKNTQVVISVSIYRNFADFTSYSLPASSFVVLWKQKKNNDLKHISSFSAELKAPEQWILRFLLIKKCYAQNRAINFHSQCIRKKFFSHMWSVLYLNGFFGCRHLYISENWKSGECHWRRICVGRITHSQGAF